MLWNYKSTARGSGKKHEYVESKQQATKNQLGQGRHKSEVKICIKRKENGNTSCQNFNLKTMFLKMARMGLFNYF